MKEPRWAPLANRFPLGCRVRVKAVAKKSNGTQYDENWKPTAETAGRWYLDRRELPADKQPIGMVCGVTYLHLGVIWPSTGGGEDYNPGYLQVTEMKQVLLVATSYGRMVKALPEDLEVVSL